MTRLSERIEAAEPGTDLTELGAEMLTFVTGEEHWEISHMIQTFSPDNWPVFCDNPLSDLHAAAALEREYLPEDVIVNIYLMHGADCNVEIEKDGTIFVDVSAPTEALARSAALVRALEQANE